MTQVEAKQSAMPAGTASAAVISLQSREVSKTKSPTGNAPVLAGAEALTTGTEPITPAETQGTPIPANGTSADAEVPANSQSLAVQPPIVPLPANEALTFLGVKPDINEMTLDEKFACLKQCFAYGYGFRKVLCEVFESIRAECKTYKKDRAGMPTVEEAFKQRGLCYKTVYSQIQREKDRRFEDAQFFTAIKAEASCKNIHGLDITDDDLPPVGTKVILGDGTMGQILTISEKVAPDAEPSFEVVTDEGTAVQVKRGDLITLAEKQAAKAAAKVAKENDAEAEKKKTERIAAAAAKEDDEAKSDAFYAAQYFNLIAIMNAAPKEFTATEFSQTVTEQLQVAYQALGEDAKRVSPAPRLFPAMAQGDENKLFKFLSSDALGRKSPIRAVFGEIEKGSFRNKVERFAQRICDKFYDGKYVVSVLDKAQTVPKNVTNPVTAPPPNTPQPPTTKVGDKSTPTAHGFYYEFIKDLKPYSVRDANNPHVGILCKLKAKTEAEQYVNDREREATAAVLAKAI
jgi:hypothetical protein